MVRIGIIGCGHWGPNYIRNFTELSESKVVMACDLDQEKITSLRERFREIEFDVDYQRLLARSDIEAVVVATPATTHYQIVKDALCANKDVLAEKPLTLIPQEGQELVELSESKAKVLMVAHTFLYNPAIRRMKEYVHKGEIGQIYYLQATRTHLGLIREDVNAVWDLATHDVAIFSYLLDVQPQEVVAKGGFYLRSDRCDVAFITLSYPDGVMGSITVSWVDSNKVRQIVVIGSKARLLFNDLDNLEKLRIYEKGVDVERSYSGFGEFQYLLRDGDIISPKIELKEPLRLQCQHFLECVRERKTPLTDGQNGLEVVRVMAATDESLRQGGTPVKI